jgi:sugar lactone lactonase YvrE
MGNHKVIMITKKTGLITTIAGNGNYGYSGDNGLATKAQLNEPFGITLDAAGNIIIADKGNFRIRLIDYITGIITSIGVIESNNCVRNNGLSLSSRILDVDNLAAYDVAVGISGNIFLAYRFSNVVRMITKKTGIITTIAGNGIQDYSGDIGPAISAQLYRPKGIALDKLENIFIADTYNNRVRLVTQGTGIITTIAGGGSGGDNGPASSASLSGPMGITLDAFENLFIADTRNGRIRMVTKSTQIFTTIAFTTADYIATDSSGNFIISYNFLGWVSRVPMLSVALTAAPTGQCDTNIYYCLFLFYSF